MSPEQASGKSMDKRADIWSFGAVLYEMLVGKKAFDGESVSDTLARELRCAHTLRLDDLAVVARTENSIRDLIIEHRKTSSSTSFRMNRSELRAVVAIPHDYACFDLGEPQLNFLDVCY